ncbi:MAG: hypothetical protein LBN18_03880 [Dysgonamonadaceae bacterium]|jgi:hypothetical protein|nr:hypothetical protein [Dysgonamonadaceae bacterium]
MIIYGGRAFNIDEINVEENLDTEGLFAKSDLSPENEGWIMLDKIRRNRPAK